MGEQLATQTDIALCGVSREAVCKLVYSTAKDMFKIWTEVSEDGTHILICIKIANQSVIVPLSLVDIMENKTSVNGFITLIEETLQGVMRLTHSKGEKQW